LSDFSWTNCDFSVLARSAFDGVAICTPGPWRVVYGNPAFWRLIGTGRDDRQPAAELLSGEGLIECLERAASDARGDVVLESRVRFRRQAEPLDVRFCPLSASGTFVGMIVRGTGERGGLAAETERRDPLTGLRDREFVIRRIEAKLGGSRSGDRSFAVVFLDLDNFKQVNDEFGHLVGDDVLREAARRIAGCVREGDEVARFGGDEFVVLVEDIDAMHEADSVIHRIQRALAEPIAALEGEIRLATSTGVALATPEHRSAENLLAAADRAMYAAKRGATSECRR
jgi:diguanylate cyclase (GGDEF)-like protein